MAESSDARIEIGGKTLVVSSESNPAHVQEVADYVNDKINEISNFSGYHNMSADTRTMLLELNIGDDYVSAKDKLDEVLIELAEKNKELFETKQELTSLKSNYELAKNQVVELQAKAAENAAKIIKLETELKKK